MARRDLIFLSYSREDKEIAMRIARDLGSRGFCIWWDAAIIAPGQHWGNEIEKALKHSRVVVALITKTWKSSSWVFNEIQFACKEPQIDVVPVMFDDSPLPAALSLILYSFQTIQFDGEYDALLDAISGALLKYVGARSPETPPCISEESAPPMAKGYVFISYIRQDEAFVELLKGVLERRGYAYWDYRVSDRDYHAALYRELEERIENAAAFISVVSEGWRETEWTAAEYIYARDAKVPVFVVQSQRLKRPFPILINQQTRIDMATDFDKGALTLENELKKKGL